MTANIRFENVGDGENNWPYRKDFFSEIVGRENIHLLGTQEGREGQLRELSSLLPQLKLIETHRKWIDERMYPSLFFDPTVFKLKRSGDIWLSETPNIPGTKSFGSMFPRLCTFAELYCLKEEIAFIVINCHLDHIEEETRLNQARVLIDQVTKLNDKNLPIILMGDFNSGPDKSVRHEINSSALNLFDPWIKLAKSECSSFHKFDGIDPTGRNERIDWILLNRKFRANSIDLIDESRDGRYPSDHFFIKVSLNTEI